MCPYVLDQGIAADEQAILFPILFGFFTLIIPFPLLKNQESCPDTQGYSVIGFLPVLGGKSGIGVHPAGELNASEALTVTSSLKNIDTIS